MSSETKTRQPSRTLTLSIGHEQLVIRRRYQAASILNDLLIGAWFLAGSLCFFYPTLKDAGIWLFVLGSAQLLIRPVIRLSQLIHLRRLPEDSWEL